MFNKKNISAPTKLVGGLCSPKRVEFGGSGSGVGWGGLAVARWWWSGEFNGFAIGWSGFSLIIIASVSW